jgi:hypothetical protein
MCRNSPHGDNWPTWQTDFFAPGRPLLEIAPWIVARDNYEACNRAGDGWARLLTPNGLGPSCVDHEAPYKVTWGRHHSLYSIRL